MVVSKVSIPFFATATHLKFGDVVIVTSDGQFRKACSEIVVIVELMFTALSEVQDSKAKSPIYSIDEGKSILVNDWQ